MIFGVENIQVRRARNEDLMLYYEWANDREVRKNAVSKAVIPLEEHEEWFESRINSLNTAMYVFEIDKKPLGQVRFDIKDKQAIIDYSIGEKYRGMGFGKSILELGLRLFKREFSGEYDEIIGIVKKSNTPSIKVFKNLDFEIKKEEILKGEIYKVFMLKIIK